MSRKAYREVDRFRVTAGSRFRLSDFDAGDTSGIESKAHAEKILAKDQARLDALQSVFYADARHALLVVLQATDTGGKDGTIRRVFGPLNPQGVRVTSFKVPTALERSHDVLWRVHAEVPPLGYIGIFNRSHYEDVLVPRVHDLVSKHVIETRYRQINDFERMLTENGVTVLKFFLHISRSEQKRRLEERLQDPRKRWKFSPADLAERKVWPAYVRAYEAALMQCSTPWAPWYVIPSDHKWYRNVVVARIVIEALQKLDLKYPEAAPGIEKLAIE